MQVVGCCYFYILIILHGIIMKIISKETTMFIVCFKDGASEISVNLYQNTVDLMIRLRDG